MNQSSYYHNLIELLKCILALVLATSAALSLESFGVNEINLILIYLIAILLTTLETKGYFWGTITCISSVFLFNFFFTQPKYTLEVSDPNYILSLFLFLCVSFIASTLVSRLQTHVGISRRNEHQTHLLYEISLGYLNISGTANIFEYTVKSLNELLDYPSIIYPVKNTSELKRPYCPEILSSKHIPENNTIALWCLTNVVPCGFDTSYFPASKWKYIPIKSNDSVFGIASFLCGKKDITHEEMVVIETILSQMALTMEREQMHKNQESIRMEMEKEQLQGNILRSISHDLRTPLTGIAGSTNLIMESFDQLDKKTILNLLADINTDANRLNQLTENLLSSTRIQEGKIQLSKQEEVVDDIIYEAFQRVEKNKKEHEISLQIPDTVITLSLDGKLIIQVLVNLLNNALIHTAPTSKIVLSVYRENNYIVFSVADNGGGIDQITLDNIFEPFTTTPGKNADSQHGMGLGLSICKSIINAHNGTLLAFNNEEGGATFRFMLPYQETVKNSYNASVFPVNKESYNENTDITNK